MAPLFQMPTRASLGDILAALQAGPAGTLGGSSVGGPSLTDAANEIQQLAQNQQGETDLQNSGLIQQIAQARLAAMGSGSSEPISYGTSGGGGVYTPGHGYSASGVSPDRTSEIHELNQQLHLPKAQTITVGPKPEKVRQPLIAPPEPFNWLKSVLTHRG